VKTWTYGEQPLQILNRKEKILKSKKVSLVNVLWQNHSTQEATWEREEEMTEKYPYLFK